MYVLSLVRQLCPDKLPVEPDTRLGEGADGEVFSIKGDPHRVLKLSILIGRPHHNVVSEYKRVKEALDLVIRDQPPAYVRVYSHECLQHRQFKRRTPDPLFKEQILYYYLMDKLYPITEDEGRVFHSILSHEDRRKKKDFSLDKIQEMLQGMSRGLDFDAEKVILFCSNIKEAPCSHLDIAVRNIMKDETNQFKLVDLDRISLGTGSRPTK